jgi:flagellar biosynthesis/type III secretory pathway protein FliH
MENFLAVLTGLSIVSIGSFALGYNLARKKGLRFQRSIQSAYKKILDEQRAQRGTPPAIAYNKGFAEGYQQGTEDHAEHP